MTGNALTMSRRAWLLLVVLSLLWGGSFFFVEVALRDLPPFTVVAGRVALAALALHAYLHARGRRLPRAPGLWGAFLVMALLNNAVPFSLIVWGQVAIDAGLAAILNATTPIFTVLLAHVLTRDERMTPSKLAGVLLGLLGVVVLIGPASLRGLGGDVLAQLAVVGASVSYALAGIYGRRFAGLPTLVTATGVLTASATLMLPTSLLIDRPWTLQPNAIPLLALAGLALLSTALAYLLYFTILREAGATNVLLVTLLIPVSAVLLGALLLGERLPGTALTGMALIGSGLLAVDGRILKALRRARAGTPG